MLDKVLITSSNNADAVCDLQEELAAAKSDAASLREEATAWQARSEASDTQVAATAATSTAMEVSATMTSLFRYLPCTYIPLHLSAMSSCSVQPFVGATRHWQFASETDLCDMVWIMNRTHDIWDD